MKIHAARSLYAYPMAVAVIAIILLMHGSMAVDAGEAPAKKLIKTSDKHGEELMESQPIVFNGKALLLHCRRPTKKLSPDELSPYNPDKSTFIYFADIKSGEKTRPFAQGHSFGSAIVRGNEMNVFATKDGGEKEWTQDIYRFWSTDLKNWKHELVISRDGDEHLFNTSVCKDGQGYLMTYESNEPVTWCTKFARSKDLSSWEKIKGLIFTGLSERPNGANPVIRYIKPYYFIIFGYGPIPNHYGWLTAIARSKDLVTWEMSLKNPVLEAVEGGDEGRNNTDADLAEIDGKTHVYYAAGDQSTWMELKHAVFPGTLKEFCASYFPADIESNIVSADRCTDGWEKIVTPAKGEADTYAGLGARTFIPEYVPPTPLQLRTQNWQLGAFLHFGLPTYAKTAAEYKSVFPNAPGMPDASRFDPKQLDAEQWVLTAKSFGAKYFVFTTKHHDGFCLWPTKTTEYCVRNTPWKDGKGDVVGEVARACRKHGMPLGLYCSPADKHTGCYATFERKLVGDREEYWKKYQQQLTEIMSNYGDLVEVWFDGCMDPFGSDVTDAKTGKVIGSDKAKAMVALVKKLQPGAIVMQGTGGITSDLRWTGNEAGRADYPLWNVIRKGEGKKFSLSPEAHGWFIPQSNYHPRPDWLWQPGSDDKLASVERLVESYYTSIGNGSNLLLNLTPDTRGLIPKVEEKRMADFGVELKRRFGKPLAKTNSAKGWTCPGTLELDLGRACIIQDIVVEEEIAKGQHVLEFEVDVLDGGKWKNVVKGQSIGRKRVSRVQTPVRTEKVRLRVLKANAIPMIRSLAAYGKENPA